LDCLDSLVLGQEAAKAYWPPVFLQAVDVPTHDLFKWAAATDINGFDTLPVLVAKHIECVQQQIYALVRVPSPNEQKAIWWPLLQWSCALSLNPPCAGQELHFPRG
jgi:hypothetical protein